MKKIGKLPEERLEQIIELDNALEQSWSREAWVDFLLKTNDYDIEIELIDNQIIGFALYQINYLLEEAHLLKIVVKPIFRKQGFGQKLLEKSIAKYKGKLNLFLEVEALNTSAIGLYKKLGFDELVRVKAYYSNGCDALRMQLKNLL